MPKLNVKELFFGGTTFCCCLPVRMGVISMTVLGMLFSGILAVLLWFEAVNGKTLTHNEKTAFIITALVETLLLAASILGFVGAVVRKQLFVQIYAYIIYFHFVLNIALAAFLLWMISHFSSEAQYHACVDTFQNSQAKQQCQGFLNIARGVFFGIAAAVLLIEMYGAMIVARYLNQLKREKRFVRDSRMKNRASESSTYKLVPNPAHSSQALEAQASAKLNDDREFDPYREVHGSSSTAYQPQTSHLSRSLSQGYGGGSWTHEDIAREEKARIRNEEGIEEADYDTLSPEEQRRRDEKSPAGPPPVSRGPSDIEELPRYTLSEHSHRRIDSL